MANAPPPYTELANPPFNPGYPAAGSQPYPPANPGFVDPSKGVQAGYPAQPGYPSQQYPTQQPQPGYPPSQYPPTAVQPVMAPAPQQAQQGQTIVITQAPVQTGTCPNCRVNRFRCCISHVFL